MSSPNPITSPLNPVLVVEDGTIVAKANSFLTLDEANAIAQDAMDTVWLGATDVNKKVALIKGARYMQAKYRLRWSGARMDAFQALDWPRRGVAVPDFYDPFYTNPFVPITFERGAFVPTNVVPTEVKAAQFSLARQTMDATGAPTVDLQGSLGRVTSSEQLGDLAVSYEPGQTRLTTIYWESQEILRPFLRTNTGGALVRS
jgi:hypothetical protein